VGERRALALRHAVVLGLLHGPTELLPISSSAHTALLPWLAGWPYDELDPQLRKSFEVALHAGTAAALLVRPPWRRSLRDRGEDGPGAADAAFPPRSRLDARLGLLAGALVPPALTGYALGARIERRLGTPATIAAGLLAGSIAMGVAEMHAHKSRRARALRARSVAGITARGAIAGATVGWRDGIALGIAQSLALFPGVSRSGAAIATARARGLSRMDADRLSWQVGLPVIAGAAALKGSQLARAGTPPELRLPFLAGAASASLSTLVSAHVLSPSRRTRLMSVCVVYRGALALLVIRRMRDNTGEHAPIIKKIKRSHSPPAREGILRRSRLQS
jgi:undecaprenyl-diphosphatase